MTTPNCVIVSAQLHLMRRWACNVSATFIVALLIAISGCEHQAPATAPKPPPEVDVAHPVVRHSVEWDEYTGRLAGVEEVEVRARVDGFLDKIHFKAGQIVKKGDLLFSVDPRPFKAALESANADVAQAQAELDHAEYELHRVEALKKDQVAPEKEYRDVLFAERKARSEVDHTLAAQRIAALNLEWTEVVAPISGRISREMITVGNLIHDGPDATLLTTIVSLDPIHCYFDADEQAYLKYSRMSRSGERASSREHATPVYVALFDEKEFSHGGHMDFVDNSMDRQTGTMRGRAVLPNPDGLLIPGLFVRVRLIGSGLRPMVFVPDSAIATDQTSRLVFVVDDKNVVQQRPVAIGRLRNGLRRILSGLDGTETVVVSGVQRVIANAPIKPKLVTVCTETWKPDTEATSQPASWTTTQSSTGGTP